MHVIWATIRPLLSIRNGREYELAVKRLNSMLDEIGTNESTALPSLTCLSSARRTLCRKSWMASES